MSYDHSFGGGGSGWSGMEMWYGWLCWVRHPKKNKYGGQTHLATFDRHGWEHWRTEILGNSIAPQPEEGSDCDVASKWESDHVNLENNKIRETWVSQECRLSVSNFSLANPDNHKRPPRPPPLSLFLPLGLKPLFNHLGPKRLSRICCLLIYHVGPAVGKNSLCFVGSPASSVYPTPTDTTLSLPRNVVPPGMMPPH